jgi:hypothetical protein
MCTCVRRVRVVEAVVNRKSRLRSVRMPVKGAPQVMCVLYYHDDDALVLIYTML